MSKATQPIKPDLTNLRHIVNLRRQELGWTIEHTANRAGMAGKDFSAWMNEHRINLRSDTALKLLTAMGLAAFTWGNPKDEADWPDYTPAVTPRELKKKQELHVLAMAIEEALAKQDMSQAELCRRADVHTSIVSRLLTHRLMPSKEKVKAIKKVLKI